MKVELDSNGLSIRSNCPDQCRGREVLSLVVVESFCNVNVM